VDADVRHMTTGTDQRRRQLERRRRAHSLDREQ
jgi:hypothetical protein